MIKPHLFLVRFLQAAALAALLLPTALAEDPQRGVRLRQRPGNVTYDVELIRGTQRAIVPVTYEFKTGDRFALRVKVAAPSYVYVLNRTFVGSPDELKNNRQIKLVPDKAAPNNNGKDDAPKGSPYSLVYPAKGNRLLQPGIVNIIPSPGQLMEMDENPGVEKLLVIVSSKPMDIRRYFEGGTGPARTAPVSSVPGKKDSPGDVLGKLNDELAAMAGNAEIEESSNRAITFEPVQGPNRPIKPSTPPPPAPPTQKEKPGVTDSSSAPKQPAKPYLIEITLAHYPPGA